MRTYSIITTINPDSYQYLEDTAARVASLELPKDWRVEWTACIGGEGTEDYSAINNSHAFWMAGGYAAVASDEDTTLLIKLAGNGNGFFIQSRVHSRRGATQQAISESTHADIGHTARRRAFNLATGRAHISQA